MNWKTLQCDLWDEKTPKEFNSFLAYPLDIDYKLVRLEDELCLGIPMENMSPTYTIVLYARRFLSRPVNLDRGPRNSKNSIRGLWKGKTEWLSARAKAIGERLS